jgi:hypothetical protein
MEYTTHISVEERGLVLALIPLLCMCHDNKLIGRQGEYALLYFGGKEDKPFTLLFHKADVEQMMA